MWLACAASIALAGWGAAIFADDNELPLPFATQDYPTREVAGDTLPAMWARRKTLARTRFQPSPGPHHGMGLDLYAQVTSPMRRYLDLVVHQQLRAFEGQDEAGKLANPVWHIHAGNPPEADMPVPFAMLLNLVSASNAENRDVLWGFISRYAPGVNAETHPQLDALAGHAIRYFEDFVRPSKRFHAPDDIERQALADLSDALAALPADKATDGAAIQDALLDVGRAFERYQDPAKKSPEGKPAVTGDWFNALYRVLLGQERGPRLGSFIALYGIDETRALIKKALDGELAGDAAA